MSKLNYVWLFVRRQKYLVIIVFVALWVGVVDDNSYMNRRHNRERLDALRNQIEHYQELYDYADQRINDLESSHSAVERMAREKYFMKRSNEDVFVIVDGEQR